MYLSDKRQIEALSLVAALYASANDSAGFQSVLDQCHAWLREPEVAGTPAGAFLQRQLLRVSEGTQTGAAPEEGSRCAVISVDDRGTVLAAGCEAWEVLRCGDPDSDPLTLPSTLRRQLAEAGAGGGRLPRALRVPLDDGSAEVAAVLLEASGVSHAVGVLRVATFLLCGIPKPQTATAEGDGRERRNVRPFRRPADGTRPSAAEPRVPRRAVVDD
jgi:hypothetical protein